jgi:two-component system response regulator DctR
MLPLIESQVFVVDDDAIVREALAWLLRSRRLASEVFESAEDFKRKFEKCAVISQPSCLLLDVRMPGLSGLALFDWLIERDLQQSIPVIFLTGHADVPTAVDAVKRGAFDFCEKPCSDNALVDRVVQALAQSATYLQTHQKTGRLQELQAELTERERDVMALVVEGLPNKLIADRLDISIRTVEVHRSRVFEKMEVKSAVELVNLFRQVPGG